jgi:hypothetical protein
VQPLFRWEFQYANLRDADTPCHRCIESTEHKMKLFVVEAYGGPRNDGSIALFTMRPESTNAAINMVRVSSLDRHYNRFEFVGEGVDTFHDEPEILAQSEGAAGKIA